MITPVIYRLWSALRVLVAAALLLLAVDSSMPQFAWATQDDISTPGVAGLDVLLGGGSQPATNAAEAFSSETRPDAGKSVKQTKSDKKPRQASVRSQKRAGPQMRPAAKSSGTGKPSTAVGKKSRFLPSLLKQAAESAKMKDYGTALERYRKALQKAEASGDKKAIAAARSGAARMLHRLGQDKEALKELQRSINLYRVLKNARARSLDYLLAGRILMRRSRYSSGLKHFEESIRILPESEASRRPGLLEDMAACQIRLHRYSPALSSYGRVLSIYNKKKNELESARILVLMGEIQVSRSDYRSARANFIKADKLYKRLKRNKDRGETLFRLAYVEQVNGNLKAAQKALERGRSLVSGDAKAAARGLPPLVKGLDAHHRGKTIEAVKNLTDSLNHFSGVGNRLMGARVRLALGNLEKDRSRLTAALALGGEALREFRGLTDPGGEAGALQLIGEVYFLQGFVRKSLEYAQESLAIARRIGDRNRMALSKVLLGRIHTCLGDTDFAWKLLKEAVEDARGVTDHRTRGRVRLAVARFRRTRGASQKVLQVAAAARKDFSEVNDRRGMADCDHLMGLVYELRGDRDRADQHLQRALKEHRAMWDRLGEGRDLTALGVHHKNLGDYDKALDLFKTALDLRKGIGNRRGVAANLANIGNLLKHKNQMSPALKSLEQALKVFRQLADKKGEADILTNLGNVHGAMGAQRQALENFSTALSLHREIQDHRGIAADLASIGKIELAKGDLEKAQAYLHEAAKTNGRLHNPRGQVAILVEIAMLERAKRNAPRALELLKKALKLARDMDDARAISSINIKTATVLRDAGEYDQALALLRKTIAMMRKQGDRRGELWALGGMGIIQGKTGEYERALSNLHKAVTLRSQLGFTTTESLDLDFHISEIYEGFKDFEKALAYYHKALAMAQITGTQSKLGKIYDRIGNIYYRMEEYDKAKEFLEDALRVHSETNNVAMRKSELIRLGDIFSKLGKTEAALDRQIKALALTREMEDDRTEARVLTRIGTLHQILGRPRTALDYYRQAKDKRTALDDRRGVNENLLQIALVTSILGNFGAAVSDLKEAFEIAQRSEDRSMLWKAYFIMGRALQGKGRLGEALESYRKAITILEAMEADIVEESDEDNFIFGGKTALFETTLRVLMKLARKDPKGAYDNQALRIVEKLKAAAFENTLSRINVESFSDLPRELVIKEKSLKLGLRQINSRISSELSRAKPDHKLIGKLLADRRSKEKIFAKLKARLQQEYPSYSKLRYPKPVTVHRLQRYVVDPDEAILEYVVTRSRTHVFAIDKQRFYTYSIDYPRKDLERDVEAITKPLHKAGVRAGWDPSVAYRLYSYLIRPVESFLAGKKTVMVIPDGPLNSLPFEILVTSKAHAKKKFWSPTDRPNHLVEKYAFCYSPSAAVLSHLRMRKRDRKPGWKLVAFGDAVYNDAEDAKELNQGAARLITAYAGKATGTGAPTLLPLSRARKEIAEIVKIVGGRTQTYFGPQATETLFKKADLSRYSFVHLAAQGVLLSGGGRLWQQPAIAFSLYGDQENDGFLELGEVFGLRLNADLVVLSSSLSSGEDLQVKTQGLWSLARAFLFSGTESVVLGMWQGAGDSAINDSAIEVFAEMYSRIKDGSKAEALRRAKLMLLKEQRTSHPYYWAPFLLIGDWRVTPDDDFQEVDHNRIRFKGLSTWRKLLSR